MSRYLPITRRHRTPTVAAGCAQVATSLVPSVALWLLMWHLHARAYGWVLLLSVPAALFMVRTFIVMHDCAHGSLFPSRITNQVIGSVLGVFTITPFYVWRHNHLVHHVLSGDLDRRIKGAEFYTLTLREYAELTPGRQLAYRIYRSPVVILGLGGVVAFGILNRLYDVVTPAGPRERLSVWGTNLALVAIAYAAGFKAFFLVELPIVVLGGGFGIFLFYVQHQFERAYFRRTKDWTFADAAMAGSSFLRLPRVLEFFTACIGYHHVHHLDPRVPNYRLRPCHAELSSTLSHATLPHRVTAKSALRALRLALYDEDEQDLISFDIARSRLAKQSTEASS